MKFCVFNSAELLSSEFKDIKTIIYILHENLRNDCFVSVIAEKFTECGYDTKECAHEAGYDAFLTGRCFIALSNFLGKSGCAGYKNFHAPLN